MTHLRPIACCGVAELCEQTSKTSLKKILSSAKNYKKGMIIASFVKMKGRNKFKAQALMDKMLRHGFEKSGEAFLNPNSGNIVQAMHYVMKDEEKLKPEEPTSYVGWSELE